MKDGNIVKEKSLSFSKKIVKMGKFLLAKMSIPEQSLCTQVLKSGTSIGANIREAEFAESKDDFRHKLKIALKEANETEYWLEILYSGDYIGQNQYNGMIIDCKELIKLLTSIINSLNNPSKESLTISTNTPNGNC